MEPKKIETLIHRASPLLAALVASLALGACGTFEPRQGRTIERIGTELDAGIADRKSVREPDAVTQALLPPIVVDMPKADGRPIEPRFDLNVANAPAPQLLMAIVAGTRYSMVVHPAIKENISISLKDVTVVEALETVRDIYGYDFKVQGNRITVQPAEIQTRVFQVNYLMSTRRGRSDVRVTSGCDLRFRPAGRGHARHRNARDAERAVAGGARDAGRDAGQQHGFASRHRQPGHHDDRQRFLARAHRIAARDRRHGERPARRRQPAVGRDRRARHAGGHPLGRGIPQGDEADHRAAGDARGEDHRGRTGRRPADRHQLGGLPPRRWRAPRPAWAIRESVLGTGGDLSAPTARSADGGVLSSSALSSTPGSSLLPGTGVPGAVFGLAFQTGNFASMLSFLQTQGTLQVLSSPRIAALNNQKAVLKVGNDEFFVTNITTTTLTSATGAATQSPSIVVQPFFSGVAFDVTPQIDEHSQIILHVHPSVSNVVEKTKNIDLGTSGSFRLPLASSSISESDTVVRVQDGNIVAIGGLMRESTQRTKSGVPGLANAPIVGGAFRSQATTARKSELVILIKPTVIQGDADWEKDLGDLRARLRAYDQPDGPANESRQPR